MNQANNKRRTKRGKRAGAAVQAAVLRDIHSKVRGTRKTQDGHNLHGTSVTALITDTAKYVECSFIGETVEDHVIPRQSLTRKQLLGVFPAKIETEPVKSRQLDKVSGKLVETTDNRAVWRSDSTLLKRGNPFAAPKSFKREGSVSVGLNTRKYTETIPEPDNTEKILGPAAPDGEL
jgi:hypothetical protein